jgi:regulator of protease activity HflC (stomatin/prohibitin superfamily)
MKSIHCFALFLGLVSLTSCSTILQDEVAVKRTLGKLNDDIYYSGLRFYNPFLSKLIRVPINTINLEINVGLPSKEGLTVQSEISILYKIKTSEVQNIIKYTGLNYQGVLILPVFRSASADVCSEFDAKDMHSAKRSQIENKIKERMMQVLDAKGFIIEAVLLKSITLPQGLSRAIEEKLQAEQDAQRMEFLKDRERKEAERKVLQAEGDKNSKIIAAEGQKRILELEAEGRANATKIEADANAKANDMLEKSLTPQILKFKQIDAFRNLSTSPNTKTIITDGKTPLIGLPADGK